MNQPDFEFSVGQVTALHLAVLLEDAKVLPYNKKREESRENTTHKWGGSLLVTGLEHNKFSLEKS